MHRNASLFISRTLSSDDYLLRDQKHWKRTELLPKPGSLSCLLVNVIKRLLYYFFAGSFIDIQNRELTISTSLGGAVSDWQRYFEALSCSGIAQFRYFKIFSSCFTSLRCDHTYYHKCDGVIIRVLWYSCQCKSDAVDRRKASYLSVDTTYIKNWNCVIVTWGNKLDPGILCEQRYFAIFSFVQLTAQSHFTHCRITTKSGNPFYVWGPVKQCVLLWGLYWAD